jgi:hypothetical protein
MSLDIQHSSHNPKGENPSKLSLVTFQTMLACHVMLRSFMTWQTMQPKYCDVPSCRNCASLEHCWTAYCSTTSRLEWQLLVAFHSPSPSSHPDGPMVGSFITPHIYIWQVFLNDLHQVVGHSRLKKYACSPNCLNEILMSWKSNYCQFYPAFFCKMCSWHCGLPAW